MRSEQLNGRLSVVRALITPALAMVLLLCGCSRSSTPEPDGPRLFTVTTTDRISTADPAAVTGQGSMILVQNVFQRLLTTAPGQSQVAPGVWSLQPDLARECSYLSESVFACTLRPDLRFSNGNPITSADVRFSIERAMRLDVPGSSTGSLEVIRRIETPDPSTVRFVLSRYDRQFGWALVGPAASIVDRSVYHPDRVQPTDAPVVGSGPFEVTEFESDRLLLARHDGYRGRTPAGLSAVQVRTEPDSAAVEEAIRTGHTDVVWRGLSAAAVTRLNDQIRQSPDRVTGTGFHQMSVPGARVRMLQWNPTSTYRDDDDLRAAIGAALQPDRTLDSVVPRGVAGHRGVFPLGGDPATEVTWSDRFPLTLGYEPSAPDAADQAEQLRRRLEDTGGMSVRLRPGQSDADLLLVDRKAWTPTGIAWLQPVIDHPLPGSRNTIERAVERAHDPDTPEQLTEALVTLQQRAASDQLLLPLSQQDENVYVGPSLRLQPNSFGPGWQLGLWGLTVG